MPARHLLSNNATLMSDVLGAPVDYWLVCWNSMFEQSVAAILVYVIICLTLAGGRFTDCTNPAS